MISETAPYNNYTGNGSTTQFDFDFYIENEEQLVVLHTDSTGAQTTLTYNTDYSIYELKNKNGSYIIFPLEGSSYDVLSSEEVLSLCLDLPIAQESEYGTSSEMDLKSIENSLDYLTRVDQIQERKIERALKVLEGSSQTPDELMAALQTAEKNAAASASTASSAATSAGGSAITASEKAALAEKWATKTDGKVDGNDYSAKYYAEQASSYVSTAQDWATKTDGKVDDNDYSAKYYATSCESSVSAAQDWATKTDGKVDDNDYSAKYYANLCSSSADLSEDWATKMDGKVDGNDYSAKYYAILAQEEKQVNNSTITLTQGGDTIDSFTLNQSSDKTIDLPIPASELDDLTDVTISAPSNGQVLKYNGSSFVNGDLSPVNDATLTITQNGTTKGTFTANASSDGTIALTDTTYTAGTGLRLADNAYNLMQEDYGVNPYPVIVGTLSESNGVYSGFSSTNYMYLAETFTVSSTDSYEIQIKAYGQYGVYMYDKFVSSSDCYGIVRGSNTFSNGVGLNGTSGRSYYQWGNNGPSGTNWFYYKVIRTVGTGTFNTKIMYSTDGTNWTTCVDKNTTGTQQATTFDWKFGGGNLSYVQGGSIDINGCYIKKNGEYWWNPSASTYKACAKATNSLYGLVKPDNSTITVNDGTISTNINTLLQNVSGFDATVAQTLKHAANGGFEWAND